MKIEPQKSIALSIWSGNSLRTIFTFFIAFAIPLCSYAQENPTVVCVGNQVKSTDIDNCTYLVQGLEFDPSSVTDNNNNITSLNYSLKKLLPNPNLVTESFDNLTWDPAHFEIGSPSGSASTGAYKSLSDSDRGTLRTVNDFVPTAQNPLYVTATLTFPTTTIAFIGTRSTGLKVSGSSNEPTNSLYLRIHNFNNGQTDLSSVGNQAQPGNAFYANPVIIQMIDNGTNMSVTMTNTVTNQVIQFSANTNYSSGSNKVVFSGNAYWDDIKISFGPHEYIQEYATGSNSLAGILLPIGETTVEWTATDEAANQGSCSFTVTVNDEQAPTVTATDDLSGTANNEFVNFQTSIPDAVISDNCSNPVLTWAMTGATTATGTGQIGTYSFAPGTTTITYTITDSANNTATDALTVTNTFVPFSGGDGSVLSPYKVSNLNDLAMLSQVSAYWDRNFILTNDIDASPTEYWDDNDTDADGNPYNDADDLVAAGNNEGFKPISYFSGQFNGQGFAINGLTIKRDNDYYIGFIGECDGAVSSLGVTNVNVTGLGYTGGLIGFNYGIISKCYTTGMVNASEYAGGLMGINFGEVANSYSLATVSGSYSTAGLIGLSFGSLNNSYSAGAVTFLDSGGGLIANGSSGDGSFWDVTTSTQASSSAGTGKTTTEMKTLSTFTNEGWDFVNETINGSEEIWAMNPNYNDGYPFLATQLTTTWTGQTSTDWNTASNWSKNEVPTSDSYVIIPDVANYPLITTAVEIQNLTLLQQAALNVLSNLELKGDLNNEGAIVFKSDENATGHFGKFTGTIYGSGTATVERYIPAKRAWRALTAPLKGNNGSLYANWQNNGVVLPNTGAEIWGPSGTGLATGPSYSALEYTATGYANITDTQTKNLFETTTNNAFLVFVTGAYGSNNITNGQAQATTLKATGSLITGDVNYTGIINNRHTMIGNPYASPLNPATLLDNSTNLIDKFWVWDPHLGTSGGYVMFDNAAGTYNNLTGSYPTATTAIQSGQAFFVRATTGNTGSFTLTEDNKTTAFTNSVFRSESTATPEIFRLGMYKQEATNWLPLDGAIAVFYPSANPEVDVKDGRKFANTSENLAFRRNNTSLSSEHHLPLATQDTLYFRVWNTTPNTYKLHLNTESFATTGLVAKLQDLYTNTDTVLSLDGSIVEYQFTVTADANSSNDRFRIVFQEDAALGINPAASNLFVVAPNPITDHTIRIHFNNQKQGKYTYRLVNTLGQIVLSGELNASANATIDAQNVATGWYGLQLQAENNETSTIKVIIK